MRIDDKDRAILRLLQLDGCISNKALAERVSLSSSACFDRVRRLERLGIIRGYHAHIAPDDAPKLFEAWANIVLLDLPQETQSAFHRLTESHRDVEALYNLSGAFDCLLHFVAEDVRAWRDFTAQLIGIGIGINRVTFGLVVKTPK